MAIRAARWKIISHPLLTVTIWSTSRTSPVITSTCRNFSSGKSSSHPHELKELYNTKARTDAPASSSASTTWLPINPSEPVTNTFFPLRFVMPAGIVTFLKKYCLLQFSRGYVILEADRSKWHFVTRKTLNYETP